MMFQVFVFGFLMAVTSAQKAAVGQAVAAPLAAANVEYAEGTAIASFTLDAVSKNMDFKGGKLVVKLAGLYYVYGQVHFIGLDQPVGLYNRCQLLVNDATFRFMQTGMDGRADIGNVYTGGLIRLKAGDTIGIKAQKRSMVNMSPKVTFFGAFKLGK